MRRGVTVASVHAALAQGFRSTSVATGSSAVTSAARPGSHAIAASTPCSSARPPIATTTTSTSLCSTLRDTPNTGSSDVNASRSHSKGERGGRVAFKARRFWDASARAVRAAGTGGPPQPPSVAVPAGGQVAPARGRLG